MKFSIIIPVYNAEGSLKASLDSLLAQSFRDVEVVFVDDCSTDDSPAMMHCFLEESGLPGRILRQEKNGGVAAARNRGLQEAQGEYLLFLDADDKLAPEALTIVAEACQGADIVGWDWTLGFEKNGRYMRQADYDTPLQALKNLMGGTMRWNLWLFSLRRDFVQSAGLSFTDGANMGEDMQFMIRAYCLAREVVQLHQALYCYNAVSSTSISRQFSDVRRKEITDNLALAQHAVEASPYEADLKEYVNHLKLFLKLPLLMGTDKSLYEIWYTWFQEANASAMDNKVLPLRTRLLQRAASKRQWWAVKLYYVFVYRFVYGVIYR
ncbi:MAG: glycosyltransferase [Bacteroidales bacterium]|nr:glycosyltransferase [Bacteroidales bacterium]